MNTATDPTSAHFSNPRAASVRLKAKPMQKAYGQRRHDFRTGQQPNYVDGNRTQLNRTLVEPRPLPEIRREIEALRSGKGARRAMKSNAAIVTSGIITFGTAVAGSFGSLTKGQQDAAFMELAKAVAARLDTRLEALAVHLDETTVHAHFELRAYAGNGTPISKVATRDVMSELQDLTADIMVQYCGDIERGNKKWDRICAGAEYSDTLNRSVKQLHQDLPLEISAKAQELDVLREQVVVLEASKAKTQGYLEKLKAKSELSDKEAQRLETYRKRLEKKEVEQRVLEVKIEAQTAKVLSAHHVVEARGQSLAIMEADATAIEAEAQQSMLAVESLIDELAIGTLTQEADGNLLMENPKTIKAAPKRISDKLIDLAVRVLGLERALERKASRLDRLASAMKQWLGRDDLTEGARYDAAGIVRDMGDEPSL